MDYDPTEGSSSSAPEDKRKANKMFKKYSDSFAQYLLENLSSNSLDSSSDSDYQSTENHSESSVERHESQEPPTIILLDSDEEGEAIGTSVEVTSPTKIAPIKTAPTRTTPTRTTPTRTTPTRTTPTRNSPPRFINDGKIKCLLVDDVYSNFIVF